MQKSSTVAERYLKSKHNNVRKLSNGDFICGNTYYSPRLVRGNTIWLSSRRYKQLLSKNAILLAVIDDKTIVEIPVKEISHDCEYKGVHVKIVEDYVRIRIPRDLKKKLDKISKDPAEAISILLGSYEKVLLTPAVGLTNEALAFRTCLYIAKYRMSDYINLLNKVLSKKEVNLNEFDEKERSIIQKLVASRVLHIDHRLDGDYVKPLCSFKLVEEPDGIRFTMIYFRDFCRLYCYRYDSCELIKKSQSDAFGFTVKFDPKEFEEKTPEELMAKWIGECLSDS